MKDWQTVFGRFQLTQFLALGGETDASSGKTIVDKTSCQTHGRANVRAQPKRPMAEVEAELKW